MNTKRFLVMMAMLLCVTASLQAQNVIRPKIACPNNIWVNSYNGVLFYQRADISIPNRSMPLEAVFYYNSSGNTQNYGYGNGWSLGSELRFKLDTTGVVIEQGDGRQDLYTQYGSNFDAPAGVFNVLTTIANGYQLTTKDGTRYFFTDTVSKRVTQVRDRYDNALNFTYNNGFLASIADINGRTLIFTWTDSLLTQLSTSFDDRTWSYQYDENQNLIRVTNPMGYASHYSYNKDNRIKTFTDPTGYSTLITYNDDGMAHRIKTDLTDKSIRYEQANRKTVFVDYLTDGNNQFSTYVWDEQGRVIEKVGNCCGFSSKLAYDNDNNVIRHEDANGHVITYTYDQNGNMLSITDALGNTERYTYENTFNNITFYTDKMGNQYQFTYDGNGNLVTLQAPLNNTTTYTYNVYGQPATITDANGNTTHYNYDVYGNLASVTDALGNVTTTNYSVTGNLTAITLPNQATTNYTYDKLDNITKTVDPLQNTIRYSLDNRGNVITLTDARQNQTAITYNALNQPTVVTGAMNNTVHYTYNAKLKTTQVQDALNNATRLFYDDHDWVTMSIDAMNDTTWYNYDNIGQVIGVELPTGQIINYQYDALNRLISVNDQLGTISQNVYDANGNVIMTINGNGDTTKYTYNSINLLIKKTDPLGFYETYTYDNNGNQLTYTDRNGNTTQYTYNALNQMVEEKDALNHSTLYTYDVNGNLASVKDANNNTTAYQYDANNKLTIITFANGKTRQFWYDGNGNTIKQKDEAGNIIQFSYDALDRLTTKSYPDNSQDVFTYDLTGNVLTATNSNATIGFTYNNGGRILSETMNGATTAYSYNTHNRTVDITYPGGRAIQEVYDLRNRLSAINENHNAIATFAYNANDYLVQRSYANGTQTRFTFNAANRLIKIMDNPSIMNVSMTYDNDGNMLSKIDSLRDNRSETYQYDAINRLIDFKKGTANGQLKIPNPTQHIQYALDALGNRTTVNDNNAITTYTANNMNAYTSITGSTNSTPQYDANGNMLSDGKHTYQYNYNNRMISVDNGDSAIYLYDALDRRIAKQLPNDTILYYYNGYRIIEECNAQNTIEATYIFGISIDDILQMKRSDNTYYYHKNHLGSVVAITNTNGNIVERYEYDPYGKPMIYNAQDSLLAQSAVGNAILFTGRDYDAEIGLYYYRARSMNPIFGRFLQNDPLMYVDGMNRYSYVKNNPLIIIDPTGKAIWMAVPGMVGAVISGIDSWNRTGDWRGALCGSVAGALSAYSFIHFAFGLAGSAMKSICDQAMDKKNCKDGLDNVDLGNTLRDIALNALMDKIPMDKLLRYIPGNNLWKNWQNGKKWHDDQVTEMMFDKIFNKHNSNYTDNIELFDRNTSILEKSYQKLKTWETVFKIGINQAASMFFNN